MPAPILISFDISISNAGNLLSTVCFLIYLLFNDRQSDYEENDLQRKNALIYFRNEEFLKILTRVLHESNVRELKSLAYELITDLVQLSSIEDLNISFDTFAMLSESARESSSAPKGADASPVTNELLGKMSSLSLNFHKSIQLNDNLGKLLDFFNHKTHDQKLKESQLINLLGTYFSNSLKFEIEMNAYKEQLVEFTQRELKIKQEIAGRDQKLGESKKQIDQLNADLKSSKEQFNKLKHDMEQLQKYNEDELTKLQRTLSSEVKAKLDLQKSYEAKKKELEESVHKVEEQLSEKLKELENMKHENEKIKSILRYVKNSDF